MTLRRIVKRILAGVLFLLGLAASVVMSLVLAYRVAKWMPQIAGLVAIALLLFFLGVLLTTLLVGRVLPTFLSRPALLSSAVWTAVFAFGLYLAAFRPIHYPHYTPMPRANTQYWNLSTGSHIAYSVYDPPAGMPVKPEPIVFVHGGPGFRAFDTDHAFYSQFTQDGFRVYLFDQVGSGLSGQLAQGSNYTVERFVADLEAIREQIGAERLILIGHSWGGTLIAHYAAAYPDHVAKLVFHSPGGIWDWKSAPFEDQRTARVKMALPPTRIMAAIMLSHVSVVATANLVPQDEFGDWA